MVNGKQIKQNTLPVNRLNTNGYSPVSDQDLATKQYVDTISREIIFYVNSDIDTTSNWVIAKGPITITDTLIPSELDSISYQSSADDPVSWQTHATQNDFQTWINSNITENDDLWRYRVVGTFGTGESGEVPILIEYSR